MQTGWITEMFGIPVVKHEIPRKSGVYHAMNPTGKFVIHSGENMSPKFKGQHVYNFDFTPEQEKHAMDGLVAQLSMSHAAPHFMVGDGRIVQGRAIGVQGAALKSAGANPNMDAYVQVECSGNTEGRTGLWDFTPKTRDPLVALLAYSNLHFGIPLRVPNAWPDDCHDGPGKGHVWASPTNNRRLSRVWEHEQGVFMHMEVSSGGNNHFDCLLLRRSEILRDAQALAAGQPSTIEPPTGTQAPATYTVKAGDNFYGIARQLGVDVNALAQVNELALTSTIHPGQILKVPAK